MVYNITSISQNTTGLVTLAQGVNNELMGGSRGILLLIGITAVVMIAFFQQTNDPNKSVAAGGYISFTLSLFLRAVDLIPDIALFITLAVAAAAIAFSSFNRAGS